MPKDASCCGRMEMVLVARSVMGHCHLGPFEIPREDELEDCPLCGEFYLEDHFIYDCAACGTYGFDGWMLGVEGSGTCGGLVW